MRKVFKHFTLFISNIHGTLASLCSLGCVAYSLESN